jgi:WD40 repeat protein
MLRRYPLALVLGLLLAATGAAADEPRRDAHGDPLPDEALQRLGTARFRTDGARVAALSPDGKRIAAASLNSVIMLDAESGKEVDRFGLQTVGGLNSLTFSPDGKRLVAVGYQGVQVLDAKSGKVLGSLDAGERNTGMRSLSFSADGSRIAVGAQNFNAKVPVSVWDADGLKKLHTLEVLHDGQAHVALSPDGKSLAVWGQAVGRAGPNQEIPRTVQLWDAAAGKELKKVVADNPITAAALSGDSKQLAVLEGTASLSVWDVESGKVAHRLPVRRGTGQVRYSPDGKLLAATTRDGAVQLWEVPVYKRLGVTPGPTGSVALINTNGASLAFLPDGKVRAVAGSLHALHVWEAPSGRVLSPQDEHVGAVTAVRFSADGKKVVGAADGIKGTTSGSLRVWDAATGKPERRVEAADPYDPIRGTVTQFLLSPDGRSVVVGTDGGSGARVVDLATEQEQFALDLLNLGNGLSAAYSADGKTLAAAGRVLINPNWTQGVRVWDVAAGRELATLKPKADRVQQIAVGVSADGKAVLTAANGYGGPGGQTTELTLWDAATGKERWTKTYPRGTTHLAFAPDGEWVVGAGQAGVHLYDAATGAELRQFEAPGPMQVQCLALSPDGRTLAAGGRASNPQDGTGPVRLWEVATGKVRAEYAGHRRGVMALAFSPDGRALASGSEDTTVLLWDLTGKHSAAAREVARPKAEDFDALWDDLGGGGDPRKAYRLIQGLAAHPAEAAALVKAKLPAAKGQGGGVTAAEIDKLIADLDDDDFDKREAASKALAAIGPKAAAALAKALQGEPSVEKKERIERLLEMLKGKGPNLEAVRPTRALELLERVGTAEAKQVLEELAKGDPDASLTREAKATLKRLAAP